MGRYRARRREGYARAVAVAVAIPSTRRANEKTVFLFRPETVLVKSFLEGNFGPQIERIILAAIGDVAHQGEQCVLISFYTKRMLKPGGRAGH